MTNGTTENNTSLHCIRTTRRQVLTTAVGVVGTLLAGCGSSSTPRRSNTWQQLRAAPTKRTEVGAAALGAEIYVAGGYIASGETITTVEIYHAASNQWSSVVDMPAPRNHLSLTALNGQIFAIGGYDGNPAGEAPTDTVWALARTGSAGWQTRAPLPSPRAGHASVAVDGKIYVVGGDGPNTLPILVYDFQADRWEEKAPVPTRRNHLGAAFVSGLLIAVAGRDATDLNVVEAYDPVADRWETLPPMPTLRSGIAVVGIGDSVYVTGGEAIGGSGRTFSELEALHVPTRTWRTLAPMPTARHGLGGVVYDGRFYVLAGGPQAGLTVSDAVEAYTP
jgi:N-acetylneuraminic acid mutarotase